MRDIVYIKFTGKAPASDAPDLSDSSDKSDNIELAMRSRI